MENPNPYGYYQAIKEYENKNYETALSKLNTPNPYGYYQAIKEYENKNYETALSKLNTIINLKNNNKIEYWAKYWRACIYYNLAIDKIQKKRTICRSQTLLLYC